MSAYTDSRSERLNSRWSTVDSFLSNLWRQKHADSHAAQMPSRADFMSGVRRAQGKPLPQPCGRQQSLSTRPRPVPCQAASRMQLPAVPGTLPSREESRLSAGHSETRQCDQRPRKQWEQTHQMWTLMTGRPISLSSLLK